MSRFLLLACTMFFVESGCFQDSTPEHSTFLPLGDYPSKFLKVVNCRLNAGHDRRYQQVFANALAGDPYTSTPAPGSVLVAEEHGDPSCGSLIDYKVMAKENPGYDSASGDWHWQELDTNQRVVKDGHLTACSSCHAQPPCSNFLCAQP